jgi:hypothetical protein
VTDAVGRYAWADESSDSRVQALAITVVSPVRPEPLAPLHPRELLGHLTVGQALDRSLSIVGRASRRVEVATDELDGWTVLIEPNGWITSLRGTLEALSLGGRAANVFWNVNALMRFGWSVDGVLVRQFDPLLYEADGALPDEAGLPFGEPARSGGAALSLLTRLTGVEIDESWLLDRQRPTFLVPVDGWSD